jgi:hypothetical protein
MLKAIHHRIQYAASLAKISVSKFTIDHKLGD